MTKPLFLQIHTLTSYPGTLLNRDDVGFAKRLPFGGATRTRVSSQCLKRHWRTFDGEHALKSLHDGAGPVGMSTRSRETFERFVVKPLIEAGIAEDVAREATNAVMVEVLGESAKAKKAKADSKKKDGEKEGETAKEDKLATGQITVLGKPEVDFFFAEAKAIAEAAGSVKEVAGVAKKRFDKEWKKNLAGLRLAAGLDAALFGRMVTSDKLSRADAAVHVAHAFTVHAEQTETDFFAAVDDLVQGDDGELGSGHIGTTELTSGLFYSYVVVDVAQLVSNLEGCDAKEWLGADRKLAADVVASLVHLVSRVSPGAKKGSTAPYAYSHLTLVEVGSAQPRTLANAFFEPVKGQPLLEKTYKALASYLAEVDEAFGDKPRRALMSIGHKDALTQIDAERGSIEKVASFAADAIREPR